MSLRGGQKESELIEKFHIMNLSQDGKCPSLMGQASLNYGWYWWNRLSRRPGHLPWLLQRVCVCGGMGVWLRNGQVSFWHDYEITNSTLVLLGGRNPFILGIKTKLLSFLQSSNDFWTAHDFWICLWPEPLLIKAIAIPLCIAPCSHQGSSLPFDG